MKKTTDARWIERLVEGSATLGVTLDAANAARLATFADRLAEWGAKMDLSSIEGLDEIREKHFLDSIAGLPLLDRPGRLIDLGSGGGFPGVVLAILRPDLDVLSVESRSKKGVFQRQVARELGVKNLEVQTARIEEVAASEPAPVWVTARALADLSGLLALAKPWLAGGAGLVAWKSSKVDEELAASAAEMAAERLAVDKRREVRLPESGDPRTLVVIGRRERA